MSELRRAEALRDSLANMIVHDLRSPLCRVMGHLELLEFFSRKGDAEKTQKSIEMASAAASMVNEMVTSLLDVSRLEAGEMPLDLGPHDLREIAETAVQPFLSGIQETRDRDAAGERTRRRQLRSRHHPAGDRELCQQRGQV